MRKYAYHSEYISLQNPECQGWKSLPELLRSSLMNDIVIRYLETL